MHAGLTRRGPVAVIAPAGHLDGRAAARFEQDILELLQRGSRFVIVDCAAVSVLTGAGLRVLLLLARSLEAGNGRLVLCGVDRPVRNVLQVAGLSGHFTVATSVDEAMTLMPASVDATVTSRLATRLARVLEPRGARKAPATQPTTSSPHIEDLATRVAAALAIRRP